MKLENFPFQIILDWYKINGRHDLPWRHKQEPYQVWISEIFLQQTQVSRVIPYFEKVIDAFPTVHDFAQIDYDTFFPYYEGLGYYSRARNMLGAAKAIVDDHDGIFPNDYNELLSLPGVGPYTSQAILAFGHNQSVLAFDTNIEKIFARYYLGSRFIKLSKEFKNNIQKQFEKTGISGREINAALMDFSSLVDINEKQNINWENYPLHNSQFFKNKGKSESRPEKKSIQINKKDAEIFVCIHKDHKEYYSENPDRFEAFQLGKTGDDHRGFIKAYFKNKFNLSLSVRPPYKKIASNKGNYFFYHAQVQAGEHEFGIFNKKEKLGWEENI
ncbi:hypothetical protein A9Q91_01645 [Candidatus Gracilibacteria bacterium 28_42_T64]|nr:hypothetical protein A9Q91_01645 [Candidatus Gracilibacteria bacterium 28_42_T64]